MIDATQYNMAATGPICFVAVGLLLGGNLSLYQFEEFLICWLLFSGAFVSLALLIFAGILVLYTGKCVAHWANTASRLIPTVALRASEAYPGIGPAENRSEFPATNSE